MSFDWKQLVGAVAPKLATAVGGPFAGMAVKAIAGALGVENESEIEQTLANASPEHLLALKSAEQEFAVQMRELGIREEQLLHEDRADARKLFTVSKGPQIALSILFIVGYFVMLGCLGVGLLTPGEQMEEVFTLLIGIMTREVPTIMQFWFGTSSGSKDKTAGLMGVAK